MSDDRKVTGVGPVFGCFHQWALERLCERRGFVFVKLEASRASITCPMSELPELKLDLQLLEDEYRPNCTIISVA